MNKNIKLYVMSDSIGATAMSLAQAVTVQFPDTKFQVKRFPFITTTSILKGILASAKREDAFIIHTFITEELTNYINDYCQKNSIRHYDGISSLLNELQEKTHEEPLRKPGINHETDKDYFKRIEATEFAVTYDDGKDPSGFLKADIVLLGVSRTSKTPLSLYFANLGYKVANLPLVPHVKIPKEIFEIDKNKIFGLTNDPEILNNIRKERMIAYGLKPNTHYSNIDNIEDELKAANELYKKIGCLVINVAHKSIEETATLILESLPENK
nr:pyruvate, water dikinase regulatory protein [uncultured Ligilactobacillus sp.]